MENKGCAFDARLWTLCERFFPALLAVACGFLLNICGVNGWIDQGARFPLGWTAFAAAWTAARLLTEANSRKQFVQWLLLLAFLPILLCDLCGTFQSRLLWILLTYALYGVLFASALFAIALLCRLFDEAAALRAIARGVLWGTVFAAIPFFAAYACHRAGSSRGESLLLMAAALLFFGTVLFQLPSIDRPEPEHRAFSGFLCYGLLPLYATGLMALYVVLFSPLHIVWGWDRFECALLCFLFLAGGTALLLLLRTESGFFARTARWGGLFLLPAAAWAFVYLIRLLLRFGCTPFRLIGLLVLAAFFVTIAANLFGMQVRHLGVVLAVSVLLWTLPPQNPFTVAYVQQEIALRAALSKAGMLENGHIVMPAEAPSQPLLRRIRSGETFFREHVCLTDFARSVRETDWRRVPGLQPVIYDIHWPDEFFAELELALPLWEATLSGPADATAAVLIRTEGSECEAFPIGASLTCIADRATHSAPPYEWDVIEIAGKRHILYVRTLRFQYDGAEEQPFSEIAVTGYLVPIA